MKEKQNVLDMLPTRRWKNHSRLIWILCQQLFRVSWIKKTTKTKTLFNCLLQHTKEWRQYLQALWAKRQGKAEKYLNNILLERTKFQNVVFVPKRSLSSTSNSCSCVSFKEMFVFHATPRRSIWSLRLCEWHVFLTKRRIPWRKYLIDPKKRDQNWRPGCHLIVFF